MQKNTFWAKINVGMLGTKLQNSHFNINGFNTDLFSHMNAGILKNQFHNRM